ncbi:hypothetical protein Phpb_00162 [Photorhabdus namnaonensis]|uniref:Uncharacterized protein n=1 Tax=Photorhabdus namnaonensis TaxID=1851568 RepID=A0A1B8YP17_9GAMM|nr:hypothetical protein Phpb_00162 [Photorhabdus namnaonensis]
MKIINLYNKYVDEEDKHFMSIRINNDIMCFPLRLSLVQNRDCLRFIFNRLSKQMYLNDVVT